MRFTDHLSTYFEPDSPANVCISGRWWRHSCQDVEQCGFACPVVAQDGCDFIWVDFQADSSKGVNGWLFPRRESLFDVWDDQCLCSSHLLRHTLNVGPFKLWIVHSWGWSGQDSSCRLWQPGWAMVIKDVDTTRAQFLEDLHNKFEIVQFSFCPLQ